jgi:hypothetical protein
MEVKYLANATFHVWGEEGTKRRFLQFRHAGLPEDSVTFVLEEQEIAQIRYALEVDLPEGAYTPAHAVDES